MKHKTVIYKGQAFKVPVLTKLEKFVWAHRHESYWTIATQLNVSERTINAAYNRAEKKVREREILGESPN